MRSNAPRVFLLGIAVAIIGPAPAVADYPPTGSNRRVMQQGVYHPGPYYSNQYLKDFPLQPGQTPLYVRLRPYNWYSQHQLGVRFGNLADGAVGSDRFPYRYQPFFEDRFPDEPQFGNGQIGNGKLGTGSLEGAPQSRQDNSPVGSNAARTSAALGR